MEAPVQSSWHTYELCIRCRLCVIARCIIIPEKVSVTIPSGTRYPWNRWKNGGLIGEDRDGYFENTFQELDSHCLFLDGLTRMAWRFAERRIVER